MTIGSFEPALKYLKPYSATEPLFSFFQFVNLDNDDARIIAIDKRWGVKFQPNFKNIINASIRAFSFYKFVPFASPYFSWYNGGMLVVKIFVSGIYLFHDKKDKAAEWSSNAAQHAAFTLYNIVLSYFVSATLINIPFIPAVYALAPDQAARLQKFLVDPETGWCTKKTKDFIYQVLGQPPPPDTPPPPAQARVEDLAPNGFDSIQRINELAQTLA